MSMQHPYPKSGCSAADAGHSPVRQSLKQRGPEYAKGVLGYVHGPQEKWGYAYRPTGKDAYYVVEHPRHLAAGPHVESAETRTRSRFLGIALPSWLVVDILDVGWWDWILPLDQVLLRGPRYIMSSA